MAVWLVRAGSQGQYEQKFIQENRIYLTWDGLNIPLDKLENRDFLITKLASLDSDAKPKKMINHASQIWPFGHSMQLGDRVILPSKTQPVIYIGKIISGYHYQADGIDPFFHWRSVEWLPDAVPRSHFSQDLIYSFGAFMTICRITRNNAEFRLNQMENSGWQVESKKQIVSAGIIEMQDGEAVDETVDSDLEELGHSQIVKLIEAKFKGHNLTRLVKAILEAQGYTCWQSPEGADGGVDILAGDGPMGFGQQRICIEVKSGDGLVDRPTVDKLMGAMTKFNATQGLFVAWGGYKSSVQKELASSFFRVRLWTQHDLLEQLFLHYDKLDEELKAELPLKRIWTVANVE
ncbi:restriction endonuclease [Shewanella sp. SG44-2]|uniref:restriction endonuclease n=1 Tax=Shewanella sp. SG44-2 TaxID=2760962 RepID=UPI0016046BAA|nr:restriction endonuclease [Shewanella sp. SG44-2]MBB1427626.1 restriction endonuclease [Shewanella sp. SG44-2]